MHPPGHPKITADGMDIVCHPAVFAVPCLQYYPRARWPTAQQVRGYGAWGGVLVAAAIYVIQVSARAQTFK